uniref:Uncharacterized protein n=3 Tax=Trichobilharzia regenti TaxID=157069 RepID=A0AA85JF74_TRIRE|nr:unnamed protein product [Trichobilharzia regenti]
MPRQTDSVCPDDQPSVHETSNLKDVENTSTSELTKKSNHSKRTTVNASSSEKERHSKAKHTKNHGGSLGLGDSKFPSDVIQSDSGSKGESLDKEAILDQYKRDRIKKKRKHSKSETKHEKHSKRDEFNSELTADASPVKESPRKQKHRDKSHRRSSASKASTADEKPHRSAKPVVREDGSRKVVSTDREQSYEVDMRVHSAYESVPNTPSSASTCSSDASESSYSQSSYSPRKHHKRLVHDEHSNEKSYKQKHNKNSRSPSTHFNRDRKTDSSRLTNNHQDTKLEGNSATAKRARHSVSSPSKSKKKDSASLSYGYRQSTQRRHVSPRRRSRSKRRASYRERSSDSERYEPRKTHRSDEKKYIHSRSHPSKRKSRYYSPDDRHDMHKRRYLKRHDRHPARNSHSTRRRSSGSHQYDLREDVNSLSPSPKGSRRADAKSGSRQHSTRRQVARYQSDVHISSAQKRDARGGTDEVLDPESTNPKPTNTASIHTDSTHPLSVSPPDLSISNDNEQKVQALCEFLDELKCEDVSDTELDSLLPSSIINFSPEINETRDNFELSSYNYTINYNDPNSVQLYSEEAEKYDNILQSKSDVMFTVDTLETLSTQIRQQMSGPENWDVNELSDPIEFEGEHSANEIDQSEINLLGSPKLDDNLYTLWQELVESAAQKSISVDSKLDEQDYVQCVGAYISGIGHRDIIPLRKRSSGLELLRNTGISRTYFGSDLLKHLTVNNSNEESNENNVCHSNEFPDTWANSNCENAFTGSGILDVLSKLVLPLSRKTDGYLRQNLLKTVKCT